VEVGCAAANIDNAGGVLIPAHVACCIEVSGLATCTLEGWDLEVCTVKFLRRYVLGRKLLPWARLMFLSIYCSTLAAPACSYRSPRGGCRAARVMPWRLIFAFFVGSCVNCKIKKKVIVPFPCSCSDLCSAGFFCRSFIVKRGCCSWPIYTLLGSGRAGLHVSFPEGRVSCRPGHVFEPELCVFCGMC